jgi:opacity protein-like surface antigen
MRLLSLFASLLAAILLPGPAARAGEAANVRSGEPRMSVFEKGVSECELDAGAFFSFTARSSPNRPAINYELQTLRLGWMLDGVGRSGIWRGNNEFQLGVFGGPVTQGPGSGLVGGEFIWRYNFAGHGSRLVPFAQIGGGGLYNDIHKTPSQIEIGMGFEFILHGGLGAHYMLNDKWAVNVEAEYRHISNAEMSSRNAGLNSLGGTLGLSYFFQ